MATARRELREETGVASVELLDDGLFDIDIHAIPARKGDPEHLHFDLRFAFVAQTNAIAPGSDATAARWVQLGEVARLETDESVLRAVRRLAG